MDKRHLTIKQRIEKKREEPLADRVTHLENEVLRELGDIGDIARRFLKLKADYTEYVNIVEKRLRTLETKVKSLEKTNREKE